MNAKAIAAIVLIVLGTIVLICSGISFTTKGETIDFLGLHVETRESHFIPPVVGVLAIAGGLVLLLLNPDTPPDRDQAILTGIRE